jgi:hypothetical protein
MSSNVDSERDYALATSFSCHIGYKLRDRDFDASMKRKRTFGDGTFGEVSPHASAPKQINTWFRCLRQEIMPRS